LNVWAGGGRNNEEGLPLFHLPSPPSVTARFGFNFAGTLVAIDAVVRSDDDHGIDVVSRGVVETLPLAGVGTTFWGTPASPIHDAARACPDGDATGPGAGGPSVAAPSLNGNRAACPEAYERPPLSPMLR